MTKKEALVYSKQQRDKGWITHDMMFEIYDDEDEIPENILNVIVHKPYPVQPIIIYGSRESIENINKAIEKLYKK